MQDFCDPFMKAECALLIKDCKTVDEFLHKIAEKEEELNENKPKRKSKHCSTAKGNFFEVFTYFMTIFDLEKYKFDNVYMWNTAPEDIKVKYNVFKDCGHDFIGIKDDECVIFQIKFRADRNTIPKEQLSTYFHTMLKTSAAKGILITNCKNICSLLKQVPDKFQNVYGEEFMVDANKYFKIKKYLCDDGKQKLITNAIDSLLDNNIRLQYDTVVLSSVIGALGYRRIALYIPDVIPINPLLNQLIIDMQRTISSLTCLYFGNEIQLCRFPESEIFVSVDLEVFNDLFVLKNVLVISDLKGSTMVNQAIAYFNIQFDVRIWYGEENIIAGSSQEIQLTFLT